MVPEGTAVLSLEDEELPKDPPVSRTSEGQGEEPIRERMSVVPEEPKAWLDEITALQTMMEEHSTTDQEKVGTGHSGQADAEPEGEDKCVPSKELLLVRPIQESNQNQRTSHL